MKKIFILIVFNCVFSFFYGCGDDETKPSYDYKLINNTNGLLYYECSYFYKGGIFSLKRTLLPNDTLLLYWKRNDNTIVGDNYGFGKYLSENANVLIKTDSGLILFYGSKNITCGFADFVAEEMFDDYNFNWYEYHWTIDSDYIDNKSCNMTLENFEKEYLKNE
jgi:hypothetical protein